MEAETVGSGKPGDSGAHERGKRRAGGSAEGDVEAVLVFQAGERGGSRPDDLDLRWHDGAQGLCKGLGARLGARFLLVGADQIDEARERWIAQFLTEKNLLLIKRRIVLPHGCLDRVVVRTERLDNHLAGRRAAPGTARHLRQ